MPPLLAAAVGSILRKVLTAGAVWLVARGVPWTDSDIADYVGAAVLFLLSFGWSLYKNHKDRIKFLIGLYAPPGTSEAQVDKAAGTGLGVTHVAP